jgi:hypothetical protein
MPPNVRYGKKETGLSVRLPQDRIPEGSGRAYRNKKESSPLYPPGPITIPFRSNKSIEAPTANHSTIQVYLRGAINSNQYWINKEKLMESFSDLLKGTDMSRHLRKTKVNLPDFGNFIRI